MERALANVCKMLGDPQLAKVSSEYFMPEINKTVTLSNIGAYKALTRLMLSAKNGWFVREKASFILGVLLSKSESLRNESFFSGEEGRTRSRRGAAMLGRNANGQDGGKVVDRFTRQRRREFSRC